MDFDPNFLEKFSDLSGVFPEHTRNSDMPIMVPLQLTSTLVPTPPNMEDHNPCYMIECPSSSINPLSIIQTPSSDDSYANWSQRNPVNPYYPIGWAPNNNKMEVSHGYLNNCKGFWDFTQEIPIQYGALSQPQLGSSLPPPTHNSTSVVVNPRLRYELSPITRAENVYQETNQNIVAVGADNELKIAEKTKWTPDEDRVLVESVRHFGLKKWYHIAKLLDGKVGKQCRERWLNHLRPNIRKDSWTEEEDLILIEAHKHVGNKWSKIAKRLTGRTENTVKNHWNATKRRLNTKRRMNKCINPKGEPLLNYLKQVTTAVAKKELKKSMSEMNLRSEDDEVDWELHTYAPTNNVGGGYVPMMVNAGEMASGSTKEDI